MTLTKGMYGYSKQRLEKQGYFDPSEFTKEFSSQNRDKFWEQLNKGGHARDHVCPSTKDMINEFHLGTQRSILGGFKSEDIMRTAIEEALIYYAHEISIWLGREDFRDNKYRSIELKFSDIFDPEEDTEIAYGIIQDPKTEAISKYTTDTYRVILARDYPDHPTKYGFRLVTAFPDFQREDIHKSKEDLREELRKSKAYRVASPHQKAYYEHIYTPNQDVAVHFGATMTKHTQYIDVSLPSDNPLLNNYVRLRKDHMSVRSHDITTDETHHIKPHEIHKYLKPDSKEAETIKSLQKDIRLFQDREDHFEKAEKSAYGTSRSQNQRSPGL